MTLVCLNRLDDVVIGEHQVAHPRFKTQRWLVQNDDVKDEGEYQTVQTASGAITT
jgi:hypothetical protein